MDIERIAQALSDPVRVRILDLLGTGREQPDVCCSPTHPDNPIAVCACDLRPALEGMAPSRLAYHLKLLREAGLVREQRRGKWVYYTLDASTLAGFTAAIERRWAGTPRDPDGIVEGR